MLPEPMLSLAEYADQFQKTPPIKKGDRQQLTLYLSSDEMELLKKIAYHPDAAQLANGSVSETVRWMVYSRAYEMWRLIHDPEFRPILNAMAEELKVANLEIIAHEMTDFLDKKARQLHVLLDSNQTPDALEEYRDFLLFIHRQEGRYGRALQAQAAYHPEVERFRQRIIKEDPEVLRQVEEEALA